MRIGIDIDDTMTDTNMLIKEMLKKEKKASLYEVDFDSLPGEELKKIESLIRENIDKVLENCNLKEKVKEVIDYLRSRGHEIYIITARTNYYSDNVFNITLNYLEKNSIVYDEFLFGYEDKTDICIEKQIDVMLDDNKKLMDKLKDTSVNGVIFDTEYNKEYSGNRVSNWLEFKNFIDSLEG